MITRLLADSPQYQGEATRTTPYQDSHAGSSPPIDLIGTGPNGRKANATAAWREETAILISAILSLARYQNHARETSNRQIYSRPVSTDLSPRPVKQQPSLEIPKQQPTCITPLIYSKCLLLKT